MDFEQIEHSPDRFCVDHLSAVEQSRLCAFYLQRMGVLNVGQRVDEQAEFEKVYKNGKTCHA